MSFRFRRAAEALPRRRTPPRGIARPETPEGARLMPMPNGIGVIDLMLELPTDDRGTWYDFIKPLLMDQESREMFKMPAEYMFKAIPTLRESDDYIGIALDEMDKYGIEKAMISVRFGNPLGARAMKEHPKRFIPSFAVNPNLGMEGVRELRRAVDEFGVKAAT